MKTVTDFVTDFVTDCATDCCIFFVFLVGGEIVWCDICFKAGSHRNDYEKMKLKTAKDR